MPWAPLAKQTNPLRLQSFFASGPSHPPRPRAGNGPGIVVVGKFEKLHHHHQQRFWVPEPICREMVAFGRLDILLDGRLAYLKPARYIVTRLE